MDTKQLAIPYEGNKLPPKYNDSPPSPDKSVEIKRESPVQYILDVQKFRTLQDMLRLRVAVADAENIKTFNRYWLHQIYRDIILDPNLDSQWNSRKMKTKEKPFKICSANGDEDKECTKIFDESPWFISWIDAVLDAKEWGFSLVEFGPMMPDGEFLPYQVNGKIYPAVNVIDRDNVKPQLGIITDTPGNTQGISMMDPKFANSLMFIGEYRSSLPDSYGWLFKACKYILFKDNCLSNWSEWAEVFGMDKRIGKTATEGAERERFIRAIRDLGSNAYGVFKPHDQVEFVGTSRTDAYQVYHMMCRYIDEQISKLVFGQDVVSNNIGHVKGVTGENVANMYGTADAKFVSAYMNKRLIPLMINLGCKRLQGKTFKWDNTEKISLIDRATIDSQISAMGYRPTKEYIENAYGLQVEEVKEEPQPKPFEK